MKDKILKYALQNAIKFEGKANPGAIIGKLIQEDQTLKDRLKDINPLIKETIKEISKLSVEEQTAKLKELAPELLEKQEKPKKEFGLKEPPTKKLVMRFEPSPSGPLHIGHAYVLGLSHALCEKYKGKLILRLADTNPANLYEPAYELIPRDAKWLTNDKISEIIIIQSERMELYYKHAKEIIKLGHAYVCTCESEDFKECMTQMIPCPCRRLTEKDNLARWERMLDDSDKGFEEGEAVVRIKTDIKHKNPAMRDWPALRINKTIHPKTGDKYRVWPLMNFAVAIDDHELKITHTIRAKEHMDNEKRQQYIYDYMGWDMPKHLYIGRINFTDLRVSCSKTKPLIEDGTYNGWDDVQLPFLPALRRRGYQADAIIKWGVDIGLSQNDKTVSAKEFYKSINAFNRDEIEKESNRYFIIREPVKIKVKGAPAQEVFLGLHPDFPKRGSRTFVTNDEFYITKHDFDEIQDNQLIRLMDCLNLIKEGKQFKFDSVEYEIYKQKGKKIIHWLPAQDPNLASVEVLMPDGSKHECVGENGLKRLKPDDIIQGERFGFMRLDKIEKDKLVFCFSHN